MATSSVMVGLTKTRSDKGTFLRPVFRICDQLLIIFSFLELSEEYCQLVI